MRVGLGFDHDASGTPKAIVPVVHGAVVQALVGATGLDAGRSEVDDRTRRGERSLADAVRQIERHNYQVVNVDITMMAGGRPAGFDLPGLRNELAAIVHVAPVNVSTKQATGTAWLQDDGGVAAIAVALLDQIADLDALHASIRSGG